MKIDELLTMNASNIRSNSEMSMNIQRKAANRLNGRDLT